MKLTSYHTTRPRRRERGSVLAVGAVGMLAFLLSAGLAVDISHFYLVKTELQNAADAAALAGASALNSHPGGIESAVKLASETVKNSYEFNKTGVTITRDNVLFSKNLNGPYLSANSASSSGTARNIRFVKVTLPPSAVKTTFTTPLLGNALDLAAEATAGMSVPLNNFCDYIPVAVIDNDDANYFVPGQTYTIRRAPGDGVSPGNYQILAIDGSGADDDREGLGKGVRKCVGAGGIVRTKPGVSAGAVRQGLNTRFGDYSGGLDPTEYPPDANVKENINYNPQYLDAQKLLKVGQIPKTNYQAPPRGTPTHDKRRVLIPLIKKSEFDQGRDEVRINRFAAFFLQTKVGSGNGGDITVEYIAMDTVLGAGGYDPAGGPPSPELSIPVLYR